MAKKAQSELRQKIKAFEQTRKDLTKTLKTELTTLLKGEIWDTFPKLEAFAWTQYTPYFNDGDTCTFGVNTDPDIKYDGRSYGDDELFYDEDDNEKDEPSQDVYAEMDKCRDAVAEVLGEIPEEFFQSMFGDHMTVFATRKGFETEEYEHD